MDEPFIRYAGLRKAFGSRKVLEGIDLDVRRGETLVVLGGSGSGKSVLLRHTIGLLRPDAGEVWVEGEEITNLEEEELAAIRRKVGMLFQAGALFDSMDVFDNVAFGLRETRTRSEEEIEQRVREVLGLVGLPDAGPRMPSDLSGGMRKRVALARAIAVEPAGLLYDEPTTGLDPIIAAAINELIRSLQRALGVTSIVVTHDIQSAFAVGDRIAFLHDGRLLFTGPVREAKESGEPRLRAFLTGGLPEGAWS